MVFSGRTLLDQAFAGIVEDEDRERPVQQPFAVDTPLVADARPLVGLIDKDDLFEFIAHAAPLQRKR